MRKIVFDCSIHPNIDQWKERLDFLLGELSIVIDKPIKVVDSFFTHYKEGKQSCYGCYDIIVDIDNSIGIYLCGVLCIGIGINDNTFIVCDLLLFINGKRLTSKYDAGQIEIFRFQYNKENGWEKLGWISDDDIEWEGVETDRRWQN